MKTELQGKTETAPGVGCSVRCNIEAAYFVSFVGVFLPSLATNHPTFVYPAPATSLSLQSTAYSDLAVPLSSAPVAQESDPVCPTMPDTLHTVPLRKKARGEAWP